MKTIEQHVHGAGVKLPNALLAINRWIPFEHGYFMRADAKSKKRQKRPGYDEETRQLINAHDPIYHKPYAPNRTGIFMSKDDDVCCVDIDDVPDIYWCFIEDWLRMVMGLTYVEKSLSHVLEDQIKRFHVFLLSKKFKSYTKSPELGIEVIANNQAIITTGIPADEQRGIVQLTYQEQILDDLLVMMNELHVATKESQKVAQTLKRRTSGKPCMYYKEHADMIAGDTLLWHRDESNAPLITDYRSFLRVVFAMKSIGYDNDKIDEFCKTQPGYDERTWGLINKIPAPEQVQIANLIALSNDNGYPKEKRPKIARLDKDSKQEEATVYEPISAEVGEFGEDVQIKPQLTPKLPARGDSVAVSGRSGGGKTTHVFSWMRDVQEMGNVNVLLNSDMQPWQVKEKCGEHNIDPTKLIRLNLRGKRHVDIEQLISEIRKAVAGRQVGIICIDNTLATGLLLWQSINTDPKTQKDRWSINSDDCAIAFHHKVVDRLAKEFNCVVVFIGHPGKNAASKDKFPGSEQLTAFAGLAIRIYRVSDSNIDEIPRSILRKFKDNEKSAKKWTLASVFKPRYPVSDYFLTMTKKGAETVSIGEGDADIEASLATGKGGGQIGRVDADVYIEQLKKFLDDKRDKLFGFKKLSRDMPNHPNIPYEYWAGIIVLNGDDATFGGGLIGKEKPDHLYYRWKNGRPLVKLTEKQ